MSFLPQTKIIDVGTGGGFPGIPLAIFFPQVQFTLVDSIAKKTKVVESIIKELTLDNCIVKNTRIELYNEMADFAVFRSVASIPLLFRWVKKNIIAEGFNKLQNGLFTFKGGDFNYELSSISAKANIYEVSDYFSEDFFKSKKLIYIPV
jgi:16S rRNA (guanine527-N7)-methyltransferase